MYAFSEFLNESFTGVKWNSKDHRQLAESLLLGNPLVRNKDYLVECCNIINDIPADELKTVTVGEAAILGLPILIKE